MNRIKAFFKEEGAKLKEMNFTDKRQYIWEYYKFQIIILIIAGIFVGLIIHQRLNPPREHYLYIAWFAPITLDNSLDLTDGLDFIIYDLERYQVFISPYSIPGNPQMQRSLAQRFTAMITLGDIDIIVFNEFYRNDIGNFIMSLDQVIDYLFYLHPTGADAIIETILHWSSESIWEAGEIIHAQAFSLADFAMFHDIEMPSDNLFLGAAAGTDNHFRIAKAVLVLFYG